MRAPLPNFYSHPALGRSCPPALTAGYTTLIKTPLMRRIRCLTFSRPARATSTIPILHARPHPIPHVLPTVACLPVSDWCCHSDGRVEASVLLLPALCISFPAVCLCSAAVLLCVADYLLSPVTVQSRVCRFVLWTRQSD